ncbi:MAG: hypothetical protein JXA13_11060 [Anaerolineales bacterium]|nr:hypothetical protein [Anaerolineales bacterium]
MKATETFTLRISPREREMLTDLAEHFERSKSSTLKALIRDVWMVMNEKSEKKSSES